MTVKRGALGTRFDGVVDFTTLRGQHDDNDPYSGFTVCSYTGDTPWHYSECRRMLAEELGVGVGAIVQPRQVHSARVVLVGDPAVDAELHGGVDGIVTKRRGIVVGVNTADCVPVLLYAYEGVGMVAAVHAGWRGTLAGIVRNAVQLMEQSGAKSIAAYIGVSICRDCFEVGDEVAHAFAAAGMNDGIVFPADRVGKAHIDLQEANRRQLVGCGVSPDMIFVDGCCSRHDTSGDYFSARRMGINSGRTFTGIMLTPDGQK